MGPVASSASDAAALSAVASGVATKATMPSAIARLRSWRDRTPGFPLGADQLGRDELSRLLYGARQSLLVGVVSTILGLIIGMTLTGWGSALHLYGENWWYDDVVHALMPMLMTPINPTYQASS